MYNFGKKFVAENGPSERDMRVFGLVFELARLGPTDFEVILVYFSLIYSLVFEDSIIPRYLIKSRTSIRRFVYYSTVYVLYTGNSQTQTLQHK
jgi:hypothetical protein